MCKYAFYEEGKSQPQIYCKLNNQICLFSKFCVNQNRYIHREGVKTCFMALFEEKKQIPSGSYYVRFIKKGFLYVELDSNRVVKIQDTLGNVTDYVYLKENNGKYEISLTPFTDTIPIKKTTNRKKK